MKKTTNKKTTATEHPQRSPRQPLRPQPLLLQAFRTVPTIKTPAAHKTVRQPTNRSRRLISKKQLLKHARQLQTFTAKATGALRALKQRPPMPARKCTISA